MDLLSPYNKAKEDGFGTKRLLLSTGQRWNASLGHIEERSAEVKTGDLVMKDYQEANRYLIAREIVSDLLLSFYNVNDRSAALIRTNSAPSKEMVSKIKGFFARRKTNIEIRAIGLQNGGQNLAAVIDPIAKQIGGHFIEIDLFGQEVRHIAIDLKTGQSYNVLLLNRIYRPGELNVQTAAAPAVATPTTSVPQPSQKG